MAKTKHSPGFEIEVGGEPYVWRLHRQPQWSSDTAGWRGMAIAVRHLEGQREAVIEFPPGGQPRFGAPQLQASHIAPALVAKAIASATVRLNTSQVEGTSTALAACILILTSAGGTCPRARILRPQMSGKRRRSQASVDSPVSPWIVSRPIHSRSGGFVPRRCQAAHAT